MMQKITIYFEAILKGIGVAWFITLINLDSKIIEIINKFFKYKMSIGLIYLSFILAFIIYEFMNQKEIKNKKGEE